MKKILFALLLLMVCSICIAEIVLEFDPPVAYFNYFYPSYLDPNNPNMQPFIFNLKASNNSETEIVIEEFHINFEWNNNELITDAVVNPKVTGNFHSIPPNSFKQISNKELLMSGETNDFSSDFDFDYNSFGEDTNFKDLVLELGYFPDGDYKIDVELIYSDRNSVSAEFHFVITTPSPITLISPGNPQGLGEAVISDLNPYFVWFSNQQKFTFKLYKIEDEFQNVEDIELQNDPIFEMEEIEATIFAYPSNAEPLEYGSLYAWQVETKIVTPLSESNTPLKSTMYFFKIDNAQVVDSNYALTMSLLMQLDNAQLQELVKLLQSGYKINTMNLGGEEFSLDDLNKLLLDFNEGNFQIKEVDIK